MGMGPRDRLIEGAIELVREHGVHGAGLAALLERSNTSRNSLYQHFPSGKGELVEAATKAAGQRMSAFLAGVTAQGAPADWLATLVGWWKQTLETSDFTAGCPVVGAALAESEPRAQSAAGEVFGDWTELLAAALAERGMGAERSHSLASFVISALEGAVVQSRAVKTTRPLDDVAANLAPLLDAGPPRA